MEACNIKNSALVVIDLQNDITKNYNANSEKRERGKYIKRKNIAISLLLFVVFGLTVFLTACDADCFVGHREAASDSYRLDIERMTGTDLLTLDLNAGDTLEIQFETAKGFICMEIKEPTERCCTQATVKRRQILP